MKNIIGFLILVTATTCFSQSTTCTTLGTITRCQTTNYNAAASNLGAALGEASARKSFHRFCDNNPGQSYRGTVCPEHFAEGRWVLDHPKFHQSDVNMDRMLAYIASNNLNPNEYKSYDKAFKALRKQGSVEMNK